MATKNHNYNFKSRTFVNSNFKQLSSTQNLNLNNNFDITTANPTEINFVGNKNVKLVDTSKEFTNDRRTSNWNKKSDAFKSTNDLNSPFSSDEEKGKKLKKNGKYSNKSTLSLHITAYENSIENSSENSNITTAKKRISTFEKDDISLRNPFEFPRQQEEQQSSMKPEVMQFKASQVLLGQNSSGKKGGRPTGALSKKTLKKDACRDRVSSRYTESVLETMNPQQEFHYDLLKQRAEKAEQKAAELENQLKLLQNVHRQQKEETETETALRKAVEQNYETELQTRKTAEEKCKIAEEKWEAEKEKRKLAEENYKFEKEKRKAAEEKCAEEREKTKTAEENYKIEKEKRKAAEDNYAQVMSEIFTTKQKFEVIEKESAKKILNLENNVTVFQEKIKQQIAEIKSEEERIKELCAIIKEREDEVLNIKKCYEKLQSCLKEMSANFRSTKQKLEEAENVTSELQSEKEKMKEILTKLENASKKVKTSSIRRKPRKFNTSRYLPYNIVSARTQQRRVQKTVQELNMVPDMKEKVLNRFKPNTKMPKKQITPLQAVTLATTVGFNPNQMENLKSFLRFFNADILPPVHKMRKALSTLRSDFEYEDFEDKELAVVGRRVPEIETVVAVRGGRLMESGRWKDVPGFEHCAFVGLTSDSGGGFLHAAVTMMNVDEAWGSPNNGTIVATGKIPKENYEIVELICGKSFKQIKQLDGKEIQFEVNGNTVTKTVVVIACFDGKMGCICSGHSGSASALPCYSCVCTKKQINDGIIGELRNFETMLQQAKYFQENMASAKTASELSKLRSKVECITKPPLLPLDYSQWIYGILHAIMGPTIKVLDIVEDVALQEDLKDLKIVIPSSKELRKANKDQNQEIDSIKTYIDELNKAIKSAKEVIPKWKKIRKNPVEQESICGAPHCLQNLMGTNPLFNTYLKCPCGNFIHPACDLIFANYEVEYFQQSHYLCPTCDPVSDEAAIKDLASRQREWETDLNELKKILKEKEASLKDTKIEIPYEKCQRYQQIQQKLKQLKVRKNLYFQKLNGVDVRKLIKNRASFIEAVREDLREDVKSLFECLNTYQELAEKQFLNDEDIERLNPAELKRSYTAICGDDVSLKVHHLTDHTPKFMMKFHFYQLVNDHAIEHVHRIVNVLLQKMCISKDEPQKALKAITDNFCLRNKLFDLGINIDNLRNLSLEEKQILINNLATV